MFELAQNEENSAVIKVIGVGGGGGNAVEHMLAEHIDGVDFICANTDAQVLKNSSAKTHIQLGENLTKGLGAGANPKIGREAAEENRERLRDVMSGADMVFITAGMGGGTGTGAAPVFAEVAKELNILTVAVITKPFSFEGRQRALAAEEGICRLAEHVDSLITIPNNKLLTVLGKNISLLSAFKAANNVLLGAVKGISDLITRPGLINVDFADVRTVMSEMGMAMMGTGSARGEQRARQAAEAAIASPLLEDISFFGARGILVNITAGLDMSIGEFEEVGDVVKEFISDDATVVVGTVIDPDMTDEMRVTVIVTGLGDDKLRGNNTAVKPQNKAKILDSMLRSDGGGFDYKQLERPALLRKQASATIAHQNITTTVASRPTVPAAPVVAPAIPDTDYLDIPAFLRKQDEDN
jgi:cell division protein FtsZ